MVDADSVLDFVKKSGPVIPRYVVKELGADTFIVGAILSTLVNENKLKLTNTKFGGTPMYYAQSQEEKIQVLYKFLHEKEKKAFDMLKEKKIIRDGGLSPVFRVALRNIKDFARPLEVNIKGEKELFWKWYMLPTNEAGPIIKKLISTTSISTGNKEENKEIPVKPIQEEKIKKEPIEEKKEIPIERKEQIKESVEIEKEEPKEVKEEQKTIKKIETTEDEFLIKIRNEFNNNKIEIIEEEIIKKNSEIDIIISFDSPVGKLKFFCKARKKKKTIIVSGFTNTKEANKVGSANTSKRPNSIIVLFVTK